MTRIYLLFLPFIACNCLFCEWESPFLGQINVSATSSVTYDSRVFGIPSSYFNQLKSTPAVNNAGVAVNEIKSEDDFILKFSPAIHLTKKISLFQFSGTLGVDLAHYVKNNDKGYVVPITNFSIDFDETLSKNKRISNNAKIRFDAVFDLGQKVSASVLEQDLVSYTFFTAGLNVRYNHSPKFGIGGGTSYSIQEYQSGSTGPRPYQDFSTLPIYIRAFYIYSEKLDFYTNYSFKKSISKNGSQPNLIDSDSHTFSVGASGNYSSKLSGDASVGYTLIDFDQVGNPSQDNLTLSLELLYKYNSKTSSSFGISRNFSPSAQGFSTFATTVNTAVNHRFTETLSGSISLSASQVDYTYPFDPNNPDLLIGESHSMNTYGFGLSLAKSLSRYFSALTSYNYSLIDRTSNSYDRHVLQAQITGRF